MLSAKKSHLFLPDSQFIKIKHKTFDSQFIKKPKTFVTQFIKKPKTFVSQFIKKNLKQLSAPCLGSGSSGWDPSV